MSLFRNAVHLGFLDRPLVVGILFALILDPALPFLGIGIFFELLWLDAIPAGTYIPPQSQLAAFVCAETAALLQVSQPGPMIPLILLAIPLAWLGSRGESFHRSRQNAVHDALLSETAASSLQKRGDPARFVLRSLVQYFAFQTGLGLLAAMCLYSLGAAILPYWPLQEGPGWPEIWGAALLGGLLALRLRRSYLVFAVSLMLLLAAFRVLAA